MSFPFTGLWNSFRGIKIEKIEKERGKKKGKRKKEEKKKKREGKEKGGRKKKKRRGNICFERYAGEAPTSGPSEARPFYEPKLNV